MSFLCVFLSLWISPYNKQNIKRLLVGMDLCSRVKNITWYCFCHSNIKSISLRNRLISSMYSTILRKLHSEGFSKEFLKWVKSYLTGRRQFVQIDDAVSNTTNVCFGVPHFHKGLYTWSCSLQPICQWSLWKPIYLHISMPMTLPSMCTLL